MSEHVFLQTERLILRPLSMDDLQTGYVGWLNDAEICSGNGHHYFPYTSRMGETYIIDSQNNNKNIILAIVEKKTLRHIGNIALQNIHPIHRSADLSILIGEKDFWRGHYGYEASEAMIQHAFLSLNLHRISCGTLDSNIGMQKLAIKLGFSEEGHRKSAVFKEGVYRDVLEYGLLNKRDK